MALGEKNDYTSVEYAMPMLEQHGAALTELLQGAPLPHVPLPKTPSCGYEKLRSRNPHARRSVPVNSIKTLDTLAAAAPAMDTHPFRIVFNNTFLSTSNSQTCSSIGQTVQLSNDQGNLQNYVCTAADILTPGLINLIKNVLLPHVTDTYGDVLEVNGPNSHQGSQPYPNCAGEDYTIDISKGFVGDFMYYVTAHPTLDAGVIAYATSCLMRSDTGAPVVGLINFAPMYFANFANTSYAKTNQAEWQTFFAVSLHEATHALGFASDMYDKFITATTANPPTTTVVSKEVSPSGEQYSVTKTFLQTPAVKSFIQNHYGCDSMPGAELEDNGGSGTAGSHWSALRIGEELMLGYAQASAPLTGLTLSLLKDSGWYITHQTQDVKPLVWGLKKGCDFALKPCSASTWNFDGYWNSNVTLNKPLVSCTATRAGVGYTAIISNKEVTANPQFQHFAADNSWGGASGGLFSFCLFNSAETFQQAYYCFDTNQTPNALGEVFGDSSACFLSPSNNKLVPTCRPQRCQDKQLQFQVDGKWFTCQQPGMIVDVSSTVSVRCPQESNALCQNQQNSSTFVQVNGMLIVLFGLLVAMLLL
ncbi:hypothetical protein SAMD00019534_058620 [Acytostelium subglobosum LB1]|uniref:hypothetical protein n=1 Tax=Acytostelium subglobosum LB1 TaxID=1410327 RepID=UPI000644D0A5|nr:hypothetical protein SAMD00019534_058620 [Acytostelium subglobosum LB1]GAM22687.1 hypothetical protein SAMD00019534_058620 [Acytostelium subglobosum LB1]|eukprot:XP_012754807.1 hypothetical protein SAMD00019534_058620 [Acytostelium subglobosum LB1]